MQTTISISMVQITAAASQAQEEGLLGFVSFVLNGVVRIGGATIRRTLEGDIRLTFPGRRDRSQAEHPYLIPINEAIRKDIEFQVLRALKEGRILPPSNDRAPSTRN